MVVRAEPMEMGCLGSQASTTCHQLCFLAKTPHLHAEANNNLCFVGLWRSELLQASA